MACGVTPASGSAWIRRNSKASSSSYSSPTLALQTCRWSSRRSRSRSAPRGRRLRKLPECGEARPGSPRTARQRSLPQSSPHERGSRRYPTPREPARRAPTTGRRCSASVRARSAPQARAARRELRLVRAALPRASPVKVMLHTKNAPPRLPPSRSCSTVATCPTDGRAPPVREGGRPEAAQEAARADSGGGGGASGGQDLAALPRGLARAAAGTRAALSPPHHS